MHTTRRPGLRRLFRQRKRGQSIPIIALMIVILVAMVGLSVDVGNTFNQERQAVSASNAAAVAGMTAYIQRNSATTDKNIYDSIANSLRTNGIVLGDGTNNTVELKAYYLNSEGKTLEGHPSVLADGSTVPDGAAFIHVALEGDVDTSFARVVGRPDLPINASAHAGLCPVDSGVYPIAVDSKTITDNQFNDNGIDKTDPAQYETEYHLYKGYYQRRIYVKDDSTAGSFSYLRWMEHTGANGTHATSAFELAASLAGEGNIAAGFEEATWPAGKPLPSGGYPDHPGTLDAGDWVWGSPGWKENNGEGKDGISVSAALDNHIANKTYMILPIYNDIIGNGENVQMRVQRLGVFLIVGQGKEPSKGPYFDMVYMGEPTKQYTVCTVTPPPPSGVNLELFGKVSFYPEYQITPDSQKPIQYVVVLDGSGSMSANFNGECNNDGLVQCANGPAGYPPVAVDGTGPTYYWTEETQRRMYVAKKALERLVRLANMPTNDEYTNSRPDDQMAVVWFREYVPSSHTMDFSSDPGAIINFITNLNKTKGDEYRSEGGTNGAAGLYRASLLYNDAPKTVEFNGQDVEYKRVVLFITDGVSNQFLDIDADNLWGGKSGATTYPDKSYCQGLGKLVVESAECQTTEGADGSTYDGMDRPITQMIKTSEQYLRNTNINAAVFVIALSNLPSTGLSEGVPSSSSYFFSAEKLEVYAGGKTNVDGIIDIINEQVEDGACIPGPSGSTTDSILRTQFVDGTEGLNYPSVGQVKISNATNTLYAPINANDDGSLSYLFPSVPPGKYRLEAYLFYRHPLDPPGVLPRMYSKIWTKGNAQSDDYVEVSASNQSSGFVQRIDKPLTLKLSGDVCGSL